MAMSSAERKKFNELFEVDEFIPPEILEPVKNILLAAQKKQHFDHATFEDLIQTCLEKICALKSEFTSKRPDYFAVLVHNTVVDYCRQRAKWSRNFARPEEFFSVDEIEMMNDALRQMNSKRDLDELIHAVLDDEEVAVILLSFYEGFTLKQVSVLLGLNLSKVKRLRADAVQKLRSSLRSVAFRKA